MKKIKILLTFMYCTDGNLSKIARRVLDSMKGNALFSNPDPTLEAGEKALAAYVTALSNAGGLDRPLVSIKNDMRTILRMFLTDLAQYVTHASKGDRSALLSSGFDISSAERKTADKSPDKLVVKLDETGQATTLVKRMNKARSYIHQYATDPLTDTTVWMGETTLENQHTFTGLASASKVWFRVIVITSTGERVSWDPVSRIIQ
jgi:hypothetical protein